MTMDDEGKRPKKATGKDYDTLGDEGQGIGDRLSGMGGAKKLLLPVLVMLLISYGMVSYVAVSKNDFNVNVGNIATTIETMQASLNTISGDITTIKNQLGTQKQQVDNLSGFAAKVTTLENSLNAFQSDVNSIKAMVQTDGITLTSLKSDLDSLKSQVADLKTKVDNWTASPDSGIADSNITYDLKSWGDVSVATNATVLDVTYKLTVTNTSGVDLEDIIFTIGIQPTYPLSNIRNPSIGGYGVWRVYSVSNWGVVFQNDWGLDLKAGETKKVMMPLHLEFDATTSPVWFESEIYLEDYDVK